MKQRSVVYAPEAQDDLRSIYDWIAAGASPERALIYVGRIERFCDDLGPNAERGTVRGAGTRAFRVIGFERRATIAFQVLDRQVLILRIMYGGRDWRPDA